MTTQPAIDTRQLSLPLAPGRSSKRTRRRRDSPKPGTGNPACLALRDADRPSGEGIPTWPEVSAQLQRYPGAVERCLTVMRELGGDRAQWPTSERPGHRSCRVAASALRRIARDLRDADFSASLSLGEQATRLEEAARDEESRARLAAAAKPQDDRERELVARADELARSSYYAPAHVAQRSEKRSTAPGGPREQAASARPAMRLVEVPGRHPAFQSMRRRVAQ